MNEENHKSRSKKKFLYLDKFTDHLAEDQKWKKKCLAELKGQNTQLKIVSFVLMIVLVTVGFLLTK